MKIAVVENLIGLEFLERTINVSSSSKDSEPSKDEKIPIMKEKNDGSICGGWNTFQTEPLWGSTLTEESEFIKSLDL
ncbi:MAG: hypothetical protein HFJ42_03680 [Clostridia bacterium]|nr:hypothetical protein [Clostridia bacterium]